MSSRPLHRYILLALAIVPLAATGCKSGGSKYKGQAPQADQRDAAAVKTDGKTMEQLFVGKFPGVSVAKRADGGLEIRIRGGTTSFYGGEEPLYVVDGTPLPQGNGNVVWLNPNDIQKIEVLKNPEDTAIYGLRGANGVIVITTKRP